MYHILLYVLYILMVQITPIYSRAECSHYYTILEIKQSSTPGSPRAGFINPKKLSEIFLERQFNTTEEYSIIHKNINCILEMSCNELNSNTSCRFTKNKESSMSTDVFIETPYDRKTHSHFYTRENSVTISPTVTAEKNIEEIGIATEVNTRDTLIGDVEKINAITTTETAEKGIKVTSSISTEKSLTVTTEKITEALKSNTEQNAATIPPETSEKSIIFTPTISTEKNLTVATEKTKEKTILTTEKNTIETPLVATERSTALTPTETAEKSKTVATEKSTGTPFVTEKIITITPTVVTNQSTKIAPIILVDKHITIATEATESTTAKSITATDSIEYSESATDTPKEPTETPSIATNIENTEYSSTTLATDTIVEETTTVKHNASTEYLQNLEEKKYERVKIAAIFVGCLAGGAMLVTLTRKILNAMHSATYRLPDPTIADTGV